MKAIFNRVRRAARYRLGLHVVAPGLDEGTDEGVKAYYNSRVSDCSFLADANHYERPRIDWMLKRLGGGSLLEIGCADGTITAMMSPLVDRIVALDLCEESIARLQARSLRNVETVTGFVETFRPAERFDWIVMSELLEHLRDPRAVVSQCLQLLKPAGVVLMSTPEGSWDDDAIEHLHAFSFESWCSMLVAAGSCDLHAFQIRDRTGASRWLGAEISRGIG